MAAQKRTEFQCKVVDSGKEVFYKKTIRAVTSDEAEAKYEQYRAVHGSTLLPGDQVVIQAS